MQMRHLGAILLAAALFGGCTPRLPRVEQAPAALPAADPTPAPVAEAPAPPPVQPADPPMMVALDPATGEEQVVGTAPLDIWAGSLSPDGRWAMLTSASPEDCTKSRVWLMDLSTGKTTEIPFGWRSFFDVVAWSKERLVVGSGAGVTIYHLADGRLESRMPPQRMWQAASPDGRYLVGYIKQYDRERSDWHAPITVLIYDLETGHDRTFADVAWAKVMHSGAPPATFLWWTPDGKGILINDPRGADPLIGGGAILRLDPATGAMAPYEKQAPDQPVWISGPRGYSVPPKGWPIQDWEPIQVRSPDGQVRQFGGGFVLGWAPDGRLFLIRWSNGGRRHCEGE